MADLFSVYSDDEGNFDQGWEDSENLEQDLNFINNEMQELLDGKIKYVRKYTDEDETRVIVAADPVVAKVAMIDWLCEKRG